MRPAKIQISLLIRAQIDQSLRCSPVDALAPWLPTDYPVQIDQTVRILKLRWTQIQFCRKSCGPAQMINSYSDVFFFFSFFFFSGRNDSIPVYTPLVARYSQLKFTFIFPFKTSSNVGDNDI